jgi:hypothetical protein
MNNNVFIKNNKNKFNPDVETKLKCVSNDRKQTKFTLNKTIYNPITGVVPTKIESQKDLVLEKDNKIDIKKLVLQKEAERLQQNELYKSTTTAKIINPQTNKDECIKTYTELKYIEKKNPNDEKYNNILSGLKDLGIIK